MATKPFPGTKYTPSRLSFSFPPNSTPFPSLLTFLTPLSLSLLLHTQSDNPLTTHGKVHAKGQGVGWGRSGNGSSTWSPNPRPNSNSRFAKTLLRLPRAEKPSTWETRPAEPQTSFGHTRFQEIRVWEKR